MNSFVNTKGMPEMAGRMIKNVEVYDLNVGMVIHYEDGGHTELLCGIMEEGDEKLGCVSAFTDEPVKASYNNDSSIFETNVEGQAAPTNKGGAPIQVKGSESWEGKFNKAAVRRRSDPPC